MATITPDEDKPAIVRTGPMAVADPPKRPRGRPPKEKPAIERASETVAVPEDDDTADSPERQDQANGLRMSSRFKPPTQADDFWEWLSRFETNEWNFLIVYLWRVSPAIDAKSGGKASNIRKFSISFDIDTIREEEGSGHYRLDVCQINPTGVGSTRIAQHFFKILNMRYPPNVPPGDWLNRPENKEWAWAIPMIEANAQKMAAAARSSPIAAAAAAGGDQLGGGNAVAMFTTLDESMKRVIDMTNPAHLLSTMREYRDMFMPPPVDGTKPDPMLMILGMMREELAATRAELAALRNRNVETAKPQSLKEQIGDLKGVLTDLRDLAPKATGKNSGDGPDWENIIAMSLPEVSKITSNLVDAVIEGRRAGQPGQQQLQPVPITGGAQAQPQQQQEGTQQTMSELGVRLRDNAPLLYKVVPILADHFENKYGGTLETAAQAFQEWMFNQREGKTKFDHLRKTFTAEEIVLQVTTIPALKSTFQPEADVRTFLDAVYADWDDVDEDEGETKS